MQIGSLVLCFSVALVTAQAETVFPATYAGGSLPLRQEKVTATLDNGAIVLAQHGRRIAMPIESITAISRGSEVRRRFGATVLGVVPWMQWDKAEANYVGVTWKEDTREMEMILKLSSRDYQDFLSVLEASTGKKALDPRKVPVVVHYGTAGI